MSCGSVHNSIHVYIHVCHFHGCNTQQTIHLTILLLERDHDQIWSRSHFNNIIVRWKVSWVCRLHYFMNRLSALFTICYYSINFINSSHKLPSLLSQWYMVWYLTWDMEPAKRHKHWNSKLFVVSKWQVLFP